MDDESGDEGDDELVWVRQCWSPRGHVLDLEAPRGQYDNVLGLGLGLGLCVLDSNTEVRWKSDRDSSSTGWRSSSRISRLSITASDVFITVCVKLTAFCDSVPHLSIQFWWRRWWWWFTAEFHIIKTPVKSRAAAHKAIQYKIDNYAK